MQILNDIQITMPVEFIMMPEPGSMAEKTLGLCRVRSLVAMEVSKITKDQSIDRLIAPSLFFFCEIEATRD